MALSAIVGSANGQVSDSPSFKNDVQPILTRYGCNSGGCHGKLAGQNGFRLSLRGYAPEDDYKWLVEDESGRRVNAIEPAKSLLLLKAIGQVAHGGGKLFANDSPAYQTLQQWIARGCPAPLADEPQVTKIAVTPKTLTLEPGQTQKLQVEATYSDGSRRDVTWLTRFYSNDAAFATVSPTGDLQAKRHGEVAAVVSYQGLVDTVVLTMPFPHQVNEERYAAKHNWIDEHVLAKLKSLRIPPGELCDDATFLRRVMLDMIGTLPTASEVQSFLADSSDRKRETLVDRLFERPEFVDYWTLLFSDLLQNRKERDHDVRGAKGVRRMQDWIREQVARNRPWDELARDVITAKGSSATQPAVGYYVVTVGEKTAPESEVADSIAQAFLGTRIGCAKCHNHPLERYTQDDYYHFIAFFSHVQLDRKSPTEGDTVLWQGSPHVRNLQNQKDNEQRELTRLQKEAADDAAKLDQKKLDEKQSRIQKLMQEIAQASLASPEVRQPRTGKSLAPQGLDRQPIAIAAGDDPRRALADWMTSPSNHAFSGAIVNRIWKHYFAVGLVEAVDDVRETNPASNQPLFEALSAELVKSGYNLRHIMKLIVTSRTYQLASDTSPENANDTRFYSHYYAKRLPAEVLIDAIAQATGVPDSYQGYPVGTRAKQLPGPQTESYSLSIFGRSDRVTACACERSSDVTLSQLLNLQNSESMLDKFRHADGSLQRWLAQGGTVDQLMDDLFLATYSRLPSPEQRQSIQAAFANADRQEAAIDLFWALLNAKEFTFNH